MAKNETLKDSIRAVFLLVFSILVLIVLVKVAIYGQAVILEPNPFILSIEILSVSFVLVLSLEYLLRIGNRLSESLRIKFMRMRGVENPPLMHYKKGVRKVESRREKADHLKRKKFRNQTRC